MGKPYPEQLLFSVIKRLRSGIRGFPAAWFVAVAFIWSWGMWSILRLNPSLAPFSRAWSYIYVAGLSGPLIAAVLSSLLIDGAEGLRALVTRLFLARMSAFWFVLSIFLAPVLWMIAGKIARHDAGFVASPLVLLVIWIKMLVRGGPLTEEIGWRGFLLPLLLSRMNLFWASAIIFPIWTLWHLPLWFLPGLPHHEWSFFLFLLWLAPGTFLFSWFYLKGGCKVWLPILFHTSVNFSLHFSSVAPARHHPGFLIVLAVSWITAGAVILVNRSVWFAPPVPAASQTPRQIRSDPVLPSNRPSVTWSH